MVQHKTRTPSTGAKGNGRSVKSKAVTATSTHAAKGRGRAPGAALAMSFSDYLARISALTAQHGSSLEARTPATLKGLGKLEALPGIVVPDELRAAWRTSDGYGNNLFSRPGYLTGYQLLSVSEAIKARAGLAARAPRYAGYEERRPRDPRIAPGWYQPGWLPFAAFGGASLVLLVDASPTARGRSGQIIAFTHDPDAMDYVAASFSEFLAASLRWTEANPEDVLGLA